jgi:deaminated glutathione amidase
MRVALVQFTASLDKSANLESLDRLIRGVASAGPDLIVCPEASMHDFGKPGTRLGPVAEPLDGPFVSGVAALAKEQRAMVVAGMFEACDTDPDRAYNTLVALQPDGSLAGSYRKLHLYDAFGYHESERLAAGDGDPLVVPFGGHRLGLLTCYDLRFPELTRSLATSGADVLVVPAAWLRGPLKEDHWATLLRARAIENTCYVAAADQCGHAYSARSMLVDPMGVVVTSLGEQVGVCLGDIDPDRIAAVRRRNPTLEHTRLTIGRRGPAGADAR